MPWNGQELGYHKNSTMNQNFNGKHFRSVLSEWYDDSTAFWLHRDGNISMIFIKILGSRVSYEILGYNEFVILLP